MKKRIGVLGILALSFFGLADSAYLAEHELLGAPLLCNIANLSGCNIVAQSPYSQVFGVPLALYGVAFYGVVFALAALELVVFDRFLRRALQALALGGFLFSIYATALQIFVIGALCVYCLASAATAALIALCASVIEPFSPAAPMAHAPAAPEKRTPALSMPPRE